MSTPDWAEQLMQMTDYELTKWQGAWRIESENFLLAEREWQRRTMLKQHELDMELIKDQLKWSRFSAIIGVVGTLAGAFLGSYLQNNQKQTQKLELTLPIQATFSTSKSAYHKGKVLLSPLSPPSAR